MSISERTSSVYRARSAPDSCAQKKKSETFLLSGAASTHRFRCRQHVDSAPEAGPSVETAAPHVPGQNACCDADFNQQSTASANLGSVFKYA